MSAAALLIGTVLTVVQKSTSRTRLTMRRVFGLVCATALAAGALAIAPIAVSPAAAGPTDIDLQSMIVTPASTALTPRTPGQTFTYTIGFSCDSTVGGTCDGATIDDLIPQFNDVFGLPGQLVPTGTPTGTAGIWASGPSFSGSGTDRHVVGTLNSTSVPGELYSMTFSVIAPRGLFPLGVTELENTATSSGNDSPTVSSFVEASSPSWTISKTGPATLLLGANGSYTIRACATTNGAAFPQTFTISDLLPAGAHFVSASNGGTVPAGDPANGTSDTVEWTFDSSNHPWPIVNNCLQVTQVVSYTEDPALNNLTGVTKTNTASGTYDASSLGSSGVGTQLRGPITGINGTKNVGVGGFYVQAGDTVTYNIGINNSSEVGALPLDGAVMTDDLTVAPNFSLTTINTGTWPGGLVGDLSASVDNSTYVPLGSFTGTTNTPVDVTGDGYRYVRITFTGSIPVGFATSGISLAGVMVGAGPATQTNCLGVTATRGAANYSDPGNCVDLRLETPQPDPVVVKTVTGVLASNGTTPHSATTVTPGDTISYKIDVSNGADATSDLTDPVVTDCVATSVNFRDPTITFGSGWSIDGSYVDAICTDNDGTPIRLTYSGPAIAPGIGVTAMTYTVETTEFGDPEGVTPAGVYPNTATLTKAVGTFNHGALVANAPVTVPAYIYLASQKWVLGARDDGTGPGPQESRNAGETDPGGSMTWFITVQNKGNVPALDPVYIDIFPHVGDTGVKRIDQTRDSEWAPYLVEPINTPSGWSVEYSTSSNPCRPEVGPNPSSPVSWPAGCEAPNWTTNDTLFALTTYHSIRLTFTGVIPVGDPEIEFSWDMRAPVYDPTYDLGGVSSTNPYERLASCSMDPDLFTQDPATIDPCPRAINSFAWAAEADPASIDPSLNPGRLSTEPPRVGVQIRALPTVDNVIGDRVWYDSNFDGLQDGGEVGVAGVYVELVRYDDILEIWEPYGFTFTDAGGNYLFSTPGDSLTGLPDGEYRVRFALPDDYYVSPPDRDGLGGGDIGTPANGNTDSDVPQVASGTTMGVSYYETTTVTLGGTTPNETDLTWDAGIWSASPSVTIDKVTRDTGWDIADAGDGITVMSGRPLEWRYAITNPGNTRLENVVITDDNGTAGNIADDFAVTDCAITNNGTNEDSSVLSSATLGAMALNRGATMTCTATGAATAAPYSNNAVIVGTPTLDDGEPIERGTPPTTVTDDDSSSYGVIEYDLAIAKTIGTPDYLTGDVEYAITVQNQGDVDSGAYDITDTIPAGMSFVSSSVAPTATTGGLVTWESRPNLTPDDDTTILLTLHIDDYLQSPFRNFVEISDDSAEFVTTAGHLTPTTDIDSTPDATVDNDGTTYGPVGTPTAGGADNTNIDQAGTGTDGEDDADIADLIAGPTYDLALAKTANATALANNGTGTIGYEIVVQNQGNVVSGTYGVTDTVPAGLDVVTPVPGGGVVATVSGVTTITWTGTSLASGASATYTFTATVADLTSRPWRNIAEISSDSAQALYATDDIDSAPDTNVGNDDTTYGPVGNPTSGGADNIGIDEAGTGTDGEDDADIADVDLPQADNYDLALAKTVGATTTTYDGTITYTITVQNQGVLDSRTFTVTDTYPAGLTPDDLDGGIDNGDGTITWTVSNLAAGDTVTRTLTMTVDDVTLRPYRNYAEISSDSADTYSAPGEPVTDVDSTPDADVTNDGDYGDVMDDEPIDNEIDGSTPAIVQAGNGADAPINGGQDDADIADVDLPVSYDLALIKTGPATIDNNGDAVFSITTVNQGNVPSGPYAITDVVPAGMTAIAASNDGSLATPATMVVWSDLESLAPGASRTVTVTMHVTDYTLRPFINAAEISDDSAEMYDQPLGVPVTDIDSVPADTDTSTDDNIVIGQAGTGTDAGFDDEDIATVSIDVAYDLALVKTGDKTTTTYDGTVTFTIEVANQGNVPSGAYSVTDTLPAGVTFVSASGGGTASDAAHVVWDMTSIEPGTSASVTVTVKVSDISKRPFINSAEITADSAASYSLPAGTILTDIDSTPADAATSSSDNTTMSEAGVGSDVGFDDEDVARFDVPVIYDLELDKNLDAGQSFLLGTTIGYTIVVTNEGNVPSGAYSVQDMLPTGLTFESASDGGSSSGKLVTWTGLTSLAPGESKAVTVRVRISDVTQSSYINVAAIIADGAADMSTPTETVIDVDSQPALPFDDTNPGEDDRDSAALPMEQVRSDNPVPTPTPEPIPPTGPLPSTGSDILVVLSWALMAAGIGSLLVIGARRRKNRTAS